MNTYYDSFTYCDVPVRETSWYNWGVYTHLKNRQYYEDLYDRHTVEEGRRDQPHYDKFLEELKSKLPKGDSLELPRNAVIANAFYMQAAGIELLDRYENRDQRIGEWMTQDKAKDDQIASARLAYEPTCRHCGEQGLRITDKALLQRGENASYDDPEDVLFTLDYPHCKKKECVLGRRHRLDSKTHTLSKM